MQLWLRMTLLAGGVAVGIAAALAVALKTPQAAAGNKRFPQAVALAQAVEPSPQGNALAADGQTGSPAVRSDTPAPALTVAPYRDPVTQQIGQLEESIELLQQSSQRRERSVLQAIETLQMQLEVSSPSQRPRTESSGDVGTPVGPPAATPPVTPLGDQPVAAPGGSAPPPAPESALPHSDVRHAEGDDGLSISIQNTDIRAVLETISRETGLNIIASKNVTGTVTANLNNVDVETALAAILKSTGYVAAREGNIIFIGAPTDLAQMNQIQDRIVTRIYRPNYVKAADLQALFTPLLSPDGKITVSTPAQVGIAGDQTKSGGNDFAVPDAIIVRDYEVVLGQLDEIFAEVDAKPRQVAIEAMILSVKLSDSCKFGVNFAALRNQANARLVSGAPGTSLATLNVNDGGLHFGFLDSSLAMFIDALEEVGDTNVIASPRLTCLNKQRAEIQIGEELGYVSTTVTESSSTQTINFLDVGTLLRIRPYIGNDGLIRLEVHPELSTGSVQVQQGLSLPQKAVTQVTTNVLCPDGCTVVIGGLIREDLTTDTAQIPVMGNLPYVGWLFRKRTQTIDRNEIIVLITPRIVSEPFTAEEGTRLGNEMTERQRVYFDKMSPFGKRRLGQHHLRAARAAYAAGDYLTAMKQVNRAIHYDPQSGDAVSLRREIVAAGGFEDESIHEYLHRGLAPLSGGHQRYSRQGYPWKDPDEFGPPEPSSTDDAGTVGPTRTILRPQPKLHNPFDMDGPPPLQIRPAAPTPTGPPPEPLPPMRTSARPTRER
jgi:type IV pilus assembly protein PilQ